MSATDTSRDSIPSGIPGTSPPTTTNAHTTTTTNDTQPPSPTAPTPSKPTYTPLTTTTKPPQEGCIRLLFNNVNALQTESPALLAQHVRNYKAHHPTFLGLIETRRNWALTDKTSQPLRNMVKASTTIRPKLVTANCREQHMSKELCQPGGVCQLAMNTVLNLVLSSGGDQLGKWAWQTLRLQGDQLLYVITAYRVNGKPPAASAQTTAWHQQYRRLVTCGLRDPDPQKQFLTDFRTFLTDLKTHGHLYIVG